jgi:hypothetical protein
LIATNGSNPFELTIVERGELLHVEGGVDSYSAGINIFGLESSAMMGTCLLDR